MLTPRLTPIAQVSQATMDRLVAEAKVHPLFEGMEDDEVRGYLSEHMKSFLAPYPWWYGHTSGPGGADTKHHASRQQYQGRREKEKEGSAMANVIPVEEMPEKGGKPFTQAAKEDVIYLPRNQRKESPCIAQDHLSYQWKKPPHGCHAVRMPVEMAEGRKYERIKVGRLTRISTENLNACFRVGLRLRETR